MVNKFNLFQKKGQRNEENICSRIISILIGRYVFDSGSS